MADWYKELEKKTDKELDDLIDEYKDVYSDVQRALVKVMNKKNYRTDQIPKIETEIEIRKKIRIAVQDIKVKTKVSFKWTPKYTSEFDTILPEKIAIKTIARAIISMDWYLVHIENNTIEAKRPNNYGEPSEKVTIIYKNNKLIATSKSVKNNICDFGKNHKRCEEFKLSFKRLESLYDENSIAEEIKEIKKLEESNKYIIPDELTKPEIPKEKNIIPLIGGGISISIVLGGVLSILASFLYIIFLYDFIIGLLTALGLGYLIKSSNISNLKTLKVVGFLTIGLTYFLSHIFRFIYIITQNYISDASLIDYFNAKLEQGIQYKNLDLGMIGLIIAWIIEILIAGFSYYLKLVPIALKYNLEKAPEDVVDFAIHWFNEGKDEDGVRKELYNKGWYEKEQQDLIINAVNARYTFHEMGRE